MSCERYVACLLPVILIGASLTAPRFVSGSLGQPYDYHPLNIGSHWYYENQIGDWQLGDSLDYLLQAPFRE